MEWSVGLHFLGQLLLPAERKQGEMWRERLRGNGARSVV